MARPATAAVRLLTGEREPVRLASTANIALYGLQTIDGVAAEVGDRVLVKDQADATQNGIYTASEGHWLRAADARSARTLQKGTTVHVQQGTASAGFVYVFETFDPVIGADAITLAFYLSDDTLGDVVGAASAAAASAAAALTSKNAAATSATNAGTSATAAAGSATSASGSATTAATSATNAGNSATAASGSASSAATSAANAGNSATAASGSASAASGSATAAATSATDAATSATNAATSASAAATSVAALGYTFSTTTTDADPGNGTLRLNNASAASATAAYVDNLDAGGVTVTGILDAFDDSTNTVKGQLTLRSKVSAAISYVYNVTGSVVDGSGYRKLTLAYVSGSGTLPTTANGIWLTFDRAGDKGADGAGTGDFSGPASSVTDNIVTFAGTTGKVGKDSGVAVSSLAPKASPTFTGTPVAPTAAPGTNTTQVATTGFVKAAVDVVLGGVSAAFDTLSEIATELGLKAYIASPTFTGSPAAPTAAPGTNTTQLATTAFVAAGLALKLNSSGAHLQSAYESPQQTIAAAGALTLAHGLGAKPKLCLAVLQCTTAEIGYSIGDEVFISPSHHGEGGLSRGLSIVPDATNINIRYASANPTFIVIRKDTGVTAVATNANWRLVIRAWL
ncbi:hypothetical protein LHFGNBLO_004696 [Mesorhizobium sp. AR10]|uniref:hypothetical protein n=1 Tax=Mesorhizobium sp. AR10 TaxID=2865839 RepID=UPI00215E849A|nr:hypothetical protein [Mesorhizobium sp. AR10]UVK37631.1 hypothetical protein LHFGNBLO_004696 [Mesorhizobium sp. AR10]